MHWSCSNSIFISFRFTMPKSDNEKIRYRPLINFWLINLLVGLWRTLTTTRSLVKPYQFEVQEKVHISIWQKLYDIINCHYPEDKQKYSAQRKFKNKKDTLSLQTTIIIDFSSFKSYLKALISPEEHCLKYLTKTVKKNRI